MSNTAHTATSERLVSLRQLSPDLEGASIQLSSITEELAYVMDRNCSLPSDQDAVVSRKEVRAGAVRPYVERALRRPGSPRRLKRPESLSEEASLAEEAGLQLVSLILHLADPQEQALVLSRLTNAADGGLMQHCVDAVDRAKREQAATAEVGEGYAILDAEDVARDLIAAEQCSSVGRAGNQLTSALQLQRLPRVWSRIMAGELPRWVGDIIVTELRFVVDSAILAQIEIRLLEAMDQSRGTSLWSGRMTSLLRRLVSELDPDGLARESEKQEDLRDVHTRDAGPGSTELWTMLPALDAEAIMSAINQVAARWARNPNDSRTAGQRRADALVQLVTGLDRRPPPCDEEDPLVGPGARPRVVVVADVGAGHGRERVWAGRASVCRDRLDAMLAASDKAQLEVVPVRSEGLSAGALQHWSNALGHLARDIRRELSYTPSASLRRAVVERDGTCRHPGCTVAAHHCDLDHVIPFDHATPWAGGLTREDNLISLCRRHHRLKTHGNADYRLEPNGDVIVRIGETCVGRSVPTGHRGHARATAGMVYEASAVQALGWAEGLRRRSELVQLAAVSRRVAQELESLVSSCAAA